MSVNQSYPEFEKFIQNELNTIAKLQADTTLYSTFPQFAGQLSNLYNTLRGMTNSFGHNFDLVFKLQFELLIEKNSRPILIEGRINKDFSLATYALTILKDDCNPVEVLRKFHFDYDPGSLGNNWPKPIFHIQYGGGDTPLMEELEVNSESLHTWLSSPRINSIPMNFALLLDMIFCEFRSEETLKITQGKKLERISKVQ